jgi:PAS domain S-box-containing protein
MNDFNSLNEQLNYLINENKKLKEENQQLIHLREQVTRQSVELEAQNDELTSIRCELELQNEELLKINLENSKLINKFNALFNFSPVGFLLVNSKNIIIEANLSACQLLERESQDLINSDIADILGTTFIQECNTLKNLDITELQNKNIKLKIKISNETDKYFRFDFRFLENLIETQKYTLISLIDISRTLQIQKQLQESEERFRSIYEQTPIGIYRTTPDGKVLLANNKLIEMLGYNSWEDLQNLDLESKDYPLQESREKFKEEIEKYGFVNNAVSLWYRKDGTALVVRDTAKLIKDKNGKTLYYQGVAEDISEEEFLRETLKAIIHALPDVLLIFDEDGNYLEVYTTNESLLYKKKEDLVGKSIKEIFPNEIANFFMENIAKSIVEQKNIVINYDLPTLSGERSFEASITPVQLLHRTNKRCVVCIARDVSERKKIELELLKSSYEKDLLFSVISYDLRDPLTSLITTADIFTNYYDKLSPEQLKKYIYQVSQEIYTLKNLVDNLLDWSKSQAGKLDFLPEISDLFNLAEGAMLVYLNLAKSKGISFASSIQPKTYCFVDRFMISSVFRNLIANAIKYAFPNTQISINIEEHENFWKIKIKDFGVGIEQSKIKSIFDEEDSYIYGAEHHRSKGLGLHICKTFIERNNGEILVESEFGQWTQFTFSVPKPEVMP